MSFMLLDFRKRFDMLRLYSIHAAKKQLFISICFICIVQLCLRQVSGAASHNLNTAVAVVSMIKNEGDILNYWLEYHSLLFGLSNMVVLDNFSTDETTRSLLKSWEQKGLRVEYEQGPYIAMGDLAYAALKKHFPKHRLAIPLDIDEFLIAYRDGVPKPNRTEILRTIDFLGSYGGPCFSLRQYYGSYPTRANDTIETVDLFTKSVYGSRAAKKILWLQDIKQIAFGAHQGTLHDGQHEKLKCTTGVDLLGQLHYHLRNPRVTAERALRDCIALSYLPADATMNNLKSQIPKLKRLIAEHHRFPMEKNFVAFHKIDELLRYAQHGDGAFVFAPSEALLKVGTIVQLIGALQRT